MIDLHQNFELILIKNQGKIVKTMIKLPMKIEAFL